MKKEFPYFNDSDVGYVDPDFLDENELDFLPPKVNSQNVDEKNKILNEEKSEEVSRLSERK